jgi:hypothetical protein
MPRYSRNLQMLDPLDQETSRKLFKYADKPYQAISGPQKLVNRFLKIFLTTKGSNPLDPTQGTNFPNLIGGNVSDSADIETNIQLAIDDCSEQIKAVDSLSPRLTKDEKLEDAVIQQLDILSEDAVEFWITITTVSRKRVPVLIPYGIINGH